MKRAYELSAHPDKYRLTQWWGFVHRKIVRIMLDVRVIQVSHYPGFTVVTFPKVSVTKYKLYTKYKNVEENEQFSGKKTESSMILGLVKTQLAYLVV